MMEVEIKFQIPADRLDDVEVDLRLAPVTRTRLRARYFDTAHGALASHKVVLRLRQEGRKWVQTAKATGLGPLDRLEHNADVKDVRGAAIAVPDVQRHADTPVGKLLAEVLAQAGEPLVEVYATDIWRLVRRDQEGLTRIELALDMGRVLVPVQGSRKPRVKRICELELELLDGPVQGLIDAAHRWSQRHGLWLSTISKAAQGERLLAGVDGIPATKATPPVYPDASASRPDGREVQQAVLTSCLAQVLPNASEIAAGSQVSEHIHQARVGLRRLRTALRELAPLAPGFDPAWQEPLSAVFQALGARRDGETVLLGVASRLEEAGGPPVVLAGDRSAALSPVEAVQAAPFQAVLVALIGFVSGHIDGDTADAATARTGAQGLAPDQTRRRLRARLRKLHARTVHDGKDFESLSPDLQHAVRKRLKRLRYLVEFVAPLFKDEKVRRYLAHLEPAQDALGQFNDHIVALQAYRDAVANDPRAWFAIGWLSARQTVDAHRCMKALGRIDQAPKFW